MQKEDWLSIVVIPPAGGGCEAGGSERFGLRAGGLRGRGRLMVGKGARGDTANMSALGLGEGGVQGFRGGGGRGLV